MLKWLLCMACGHLLLALVLALDETDPQLDNNLNGYESSRDGDTHSKLPSEVQRAVCTVNAGEVKASAEAVTTKTLKGVCGSDEMNLAFRNLEEKLYKELYDIKELLTKLTELREHQDSNSIPLMPSVLKPTAMQRFKFEQITIKPNLVLKSIEQVRQKDMESDQERDDDVYKFNNTMLSDQDFKIFTYYWKLENITEHTGNASTTTLKSPIFSIKGKTVQLKCTFHHLHREMIFLQLSLAYPSDRGKQNNIVLDMGGQLKQLKWAENVLFKHKISVLDQSQSRTPNLNSQVLTKLDMGFPIPNSAIIGSNYVRHNSILIQVILYL